MLKVSTSVKRFNNSKLKIYSSTNSKQPLTPKTYHLAIINPQPTTNNHQPSTNNPLFQIIISGSFNDIAGGEAFFGDDGEAVF